MVVIAKIKTSFLDFVVFILLIASPTRKLKPVEEKRTTQGKGIFNEKILDVGWLKPKNI